MPLSKIRHAISYNSHDTMLRNQTTGRLTLRTGVEERINTIVHYLTRTKIWVGKLDVLQHLQSIHPSYRYTDVEYAIKKMDKLGLLVHNEGIMGAGTGPLFRLALQGKQTWQAVRSS